MLQTNIIGTYNGSRVALEHFLTRALAAEYTESNIGVFALNPGLVLTEMITKVDVIDGHEDRVRPFDTITRMWGNPPAVPAKRAMWLSRAATDGKTGIEAHSLTINTVEPASSRFKR